MWLLIVDIFGSGTDQPGQMLVHLWDMLVVKELLVLADPADLRDPRDLRAFAAMMEQV
jgi:hypothetical protein